MGIEEDKLRLLEHLKKVDQEIHRLIQELEAGLKKEAPQEGRGGFASLYGILKGQMDTTWEEIEAAKYKVKEFPE